MEGPLFWKHDLTVLWDTPFDIIPSQEMTNAEQWNALTRFCIYGAATIMLLGLQESIAVFLLAIVVCIYLLNPDESISELIFKVNSREGFLSILKPNVTRHASSDCRSPTKNNPYMNVTVDEYSSEKANRPPACNLSNPNISAQAHKHFTGDLYQDVDDLFGKKTSERNFYTTPITTVPNDQTKFAQWLYGNGAPEKDAFKAMQM